MGVWGSGPFENDAAADLLRELGAARDPTRRIRDELSSVLESGMDSDDALRCVAMCELLALARHDDETETPTRSARALGPVVPLIERLKPRPALVSKALTALERAVAVPYEFAEWLDPSWPTIESIAGRLGGEIRRPARVRQTRPKATRPQIIAARPSWLLLETGTLLINANLSARDLAVLARHRVDEIRLVRPFTATVDTQKIIAILNERRRPQLTTGQRPAPTRR